MNENKLFESAWFEFAEHDYNSAKHLFDTMYPKPLEIICYHCEQAVEKYLKGILVYFGNTNKKTHDVSFLLEECEKCLGVSIEEEYFDICDMLTPYGVAVRYPHEIYVDEIMAKKALDSVVEIKNMLLEIIRKL